MNSQMDVHNMLRARVAQKYAKEGYQIFIEPQKSHLPFDLGAYRPDVIAMKSPTEGYVIEIKNHIQRVSVDKLRELAEIVAQHNGWRFLLVTGDDIAMREQGQYRDMQLLSWQQILSRKEKAENLISLGEIEGAFLLFWGIFEAMLRQQAEKVSIPIEHFPTSSLIKHLYSQGELSIAQFDKAIELLTVRNDFIHGFQSSRLDASIVELKKLVEELIALWHQ